jgi:ribosomal protein S18 acetylase RimI-like enzyme
MRELPLAWRTDLSILEMSGAQVTRFDGHILVQSPDNPGYHWGNCILVTSGDLAGDPARCLRTFEVYLPGAEHVAIGLPTAPSPDVWRPFGVQVESTQSLMRRAPLSPGALPPGDDVRQLLSDDDWELVTRADVAEHADLPGYEDFACRRVAAHRRLTDDGVGAFFGVFAGAELVADLGIVVCWQQVARYQNVSTVSEHRGRGLASHLLGVASRWADDRGVDTWLIVAEPDSAAARLYRALGFRPTGERSFEVYRTAG